MENLNLHVVSNEDAIYQTIASVANAQGFTVSHSKSAKQAIACFSQTSPAILILDQDLPNYKDLDLIAKQSIATCGTAVILLHSPFQERNQSSFYSGVGKANILAHFEKPLAEDKLLQQLSDVAKSRHTISAEQLQQAIQTDQLALFYQPRVCLVTQQIHSAKVLIRWQHPQQGLLNPHQFLPLAEEYNLVSQVNEWTLQASFQQFAIWLRSNTNLRLNINLPDFKHLDDDFIKTLEKAIAQYQFQPSRISFEIQEKTILNINYVKQLNDIADLGFELTANNFSGENLNLAQLCQLPISSLNIKKEYILNMERDPQAAAIAKAIIHLGKGLDKKVCAIGIEDTDTWQKLNDMGCDYGQGFYINRPVSVSEFNKWLLLC